ncbi:hypothetical protein MC378_02385 [Polaribacter sp. MSW13]|uniref:Uncharacterized protein n=1 Tax=Polaribacter marinus TaxID=2916838 RepID=A0A9X2ALN2_9FLAO|nr:hypothetical protein [Polaribacter marinus]MCI2227999.1 hypothetical protein [Polaribacter marinus]
MIFATSLKKINKLHLIAVFFISFLLMGCPKESNFSIADKPNLKIDKRLLGTWKIKTPKTYFVEEIKFSKLSSKEYRLTVTKEGGDYDTSTKIFRAYLTKFKGTNYLTVNNEKKGTNYFFHIYKISRNKLIFYELKIPLDLKSTNEFRNSISKKPVFTDESVWVKK